MKNKKLQIPMSDTEESMVRKAAQIYHVTTAEWARRVLRKAAERDLAAEVVLDPMDAVLMLSKLQAPVSEPEQMKQESLSGRYK